MSQVQSRFSRKVLAWWLIVAFVLPVAFFAETIILLEQTVQYSATWRMAIWWVLLCGAVVFVLGLAVSATSRSGGVLLLVLFSVFSLFFLKLEYIESFVALSQSLKIAIAIAMVAIGWFFFIKLKIADKFPSPIFILVVVAIFVVVPFASAKIEGVGGGEERLSEQALAKCFTDYVDQHDDLKIAFDSRPGGLTKAQWGERHYTNFGNAEKRKLAGRCSQLNTPDLADNDSELLGCFETVDQVRLAERPNLYILLFDALIPEPIAESFFGVGSAGYGKVLRDHFHIPDGVTLQNRTPSKPSIRSVMWLDTMEPNNLWKRTKYGEFPGRVDSPLARLFRSNGYSITTGFFREFWSNPGIYIDRWLTLEPTFGNTMLCLEPAKSLRDHLKGFGICSLLGDYEKMPTVGEVIAEPGRESNTEARYLKWRQKVLDNLEQIPKAQNPQLTFLYIFDPIGHTPKGFKFRDLDLVEYRRYFERKGAEAARYLEEIVETLSRSDPGAILLVGGDHGLMLSRGSKNTRFVIVDQRGVAIGIWKSQNACASRVGEQGFSPNSQGYHTISTALRSVIACLAERPESVTSLPLVARFDASVVGKSWAEFLARNIDPETRAILEGSRSE